MNKKRNTCVSVESSYSDNLYNLLSLSENIYDKT